MTSHGSMKLRCALLLVAVGIWLTGAAQARTINVPAEYATIQAAINAAVRGDVVVVAPGTYKENIDFKGKAITVRGSNAASAAVVAATIIDGDKKGSVVTFKTGETAASVLSGFTITNGTGTAHWGSLAGGGIYCSGSAPTLTRNTIVGNYAALLGGGVYLQASSPVLTSNTIDGNSAANGGGGVCCYESSPSLRNNTISGNSAQRFGAAGGGVLCEKNSSPSLINNVIEGNSATSGGGVNCHESSPALTGNTISNNTSEGSAGGGVFCGVLSSPALTGNTIRGNRANSLNSDLDCGGGGVYCQESSVTLTNNVIRNNVAYGHFGGGGVMCWWSSPTISGNIISGNVATGSSINEGNGGGVYCHESPSNYVLNLTNNTISGNSAQGAGGGVRCDGSSPSLRNNIISANTASIGGGVSCDYGVPVLISNTVSGNTGGGVSFFSGSPVVRNSIIAFNSGGGLIYCADPEGASSLPTITYCDFYGNTGGNYVGMASQTGKNGNISKNPLFANLAKGDFHEKSKGGRYNPAAKIWVVDTVQGPCIDAGDPTSAFALEPTPNGGRINMGAYGNTKYASKSAPVRVAGSLLVSAAAAPVSGGGVQLSVNLSSAASVEVTISNIAGRAVAALSVRDLPEGVSTLLWSGVSATGLRVPAGTYLVRLTARTEDGSQGQALATVNLQR